MGVLTTCTVRFLKKSPVRTAATALGIVLATALILAVITSAASLYRYLVDVEMAKSGSFNGMAIGATAQEVEQVDTAMGVTRCAAVEIEGYALLNEGGQVPYVAIEGLVPGVGTDRDFAELVSLNIVEGGLPTSPDEILLPRTLRQSKVIDAGVGDRVTLEVGTRVRLETGDPLVGDSLVWADEKGLELGEKLVDAEPRTFVICGFYADNNPLFYRDGYGSTVAGFPALTVPPLWRTPPPTHPTSCGPRSRTRAPSRTFWAPCSAPAMPRCATTITSTASRRSPGKWAAIGRCLTLQPSCWCSSWAARCC